MNTQAQPSPVTAGGVLALLLKDFLTSVYGESVPLDDVTVGFCTVFLDFFAQIPPETADRYRQFVVDSLLSQETRQ